MWSSLLLGDASMFIDVLPHQRLTTALDAMKAFSAFNRILFYRVAC